MKFTPKTLALGLAALVCVFYLATLRPGQGWMDDYAQYVLHARNLAEGRPYADTGYIFNPAYQFSGPVTYPPVFPLLLVPVYKFAGLDLQAMKAETVLFFGAFLYVLILFFSERLGPERAALIAGLVGFSPVFWKFKDYLYAEYPFLFFSFAALYLYGRARAAEAAGGGWKARALAAGLLTYLAYGTRSAGALLLPVFLLTDLAAEKKLSRTFIVVFTAAVVPALAQTFTLHSDAVYVEQARAWFARTSLLAAVKNNLRDYPGRFALLFNNVWRPAVGTLLLMAAAAAAVPGFVLKAREKVSLPECYAVVNFLFLLVCPAADGLRYAFPLVPLLFFYAVIGFEAAGGRWRSARYAGPGLLALVLLSYAGAYAKADWSGFAEGTDKKETAELLDYVRKEIPVSDAVIFRKPRTLALYTGRRASMYNGAPDTELLAYFGRIGAGWLISGSVFPEDAVSLQPFIERNPGAFRKVYANPDFRVYKIIREK